MQGKSNQNWQKKISNISQPVEICYGGFLKLIYSWFVNSTGPRPQQRLKDSKKIIHILITIFSVKKFEAKFVNTKFGQIKTRSKMTGFLN